MIAYASLRRNDTSSRQTTFEFGIDHLFVKESTLTDNGLLQPGAPIPKGANSKTESSLFNKG